MSYTVHYGWVVSGRKRQTASYKQATNNLQPQACSLQHEIIDEALLTVMRKPRSYTREDVVEISCHGGIVALRATLDLVLDNGCRLAKPGEFTKRAFLNGRIDLSQAEAVLDIIRAKTDSALKIGVEQLGGFLSRQITRIRNSLLEALSILEANIDFPEEEISPADIKEMHNKLVLIQAQIKNILNEANSGRIFREGINAVICGRPNVGKSSLLNALLKQERSIVTPVAGTTRDIIEETIDIKGIPVRIMDTAGIFEPRDLVERKAVARSKRCIDLADLVILMFDANKKLNKDDESLMRRFKKKNTIAIINKIDLKQIIQKEKVLKYFPQAIEISAKKLRNIFLLEEGISRLIYKGKLPCNDSVFISNLRHIQDLKKTEKFIAEARESLDNALSIEFVAQNIKDALGYLDDVLGKRFSQDLLDKIFSEFCIGK